MAQKAFQGALGLLRPQEGLICPVQIFLHSFCRRSEECHWCQQEGSCPPHPPCDGQAPGEQWGVTQTGKLLGTQPFPAGTEKRHSGSHSGLKPGVLAAKTAYRAHTGVSIPPGSSHSHPMSLQPLHCPLKTRSFPEFLSLKTRSVTTP